MFLVSNLVGSTIQITTLPLPVLSTLQASGLVFNSICATLILGEPFTRWSLGGTLLVASGALLIAIFGAISEPAHSLDGLLVLLGRRPFVIWMICQALLVAAIIAIASFLTRFRKLSLSPQIRLLQGLAYGGISGILSAHSLLVAKTAVELLVRTIIDRHNQFNRWQSWAILMGLIFLALTQLYYLHRGLKLVSTSVLYPLVFCIYNIIAILDGLIYFKQTSRLTLLHACLIALGTVILLSGVLALSWRLSDEQTQPAVAQSALAPGLGLVEDTDNDESSDSANADEEASIGTEREPLLGQEPGTPNTRLATMPKTPSPRKTLRLTEADEIWGELEDDDSKATPSRPVRTMTFPNTQLGHGSEASPSQDPDEDTPLIHPSTLSRRRRRRSTGFPGFTARASPLRSTSSRWRGLQQRPSSQGSGGDTGWGWKLKWWKTESNNPSRTNTVPPSPFMHESGDDPGEGSSAIM